MRRKRNKLNNRRKCEFKFFKCVTLSPSLAYLIMCPFKSTVRCQICWTRQDWRCSKPAMTWLRYDEWWCDFDIYSKSIHFFIELQEIDLFFIFLMWFFAGSPKRCKATDGQHCQRPKSVPDSAGGAGVTGQLMVLLAMLAFFFFFLNSF